MPESGGLASLIAGFFAARAGLPVGRPYGDLLSGRTFGHTGFTGTSLAIDPERDLGSSFDRMEFCWSLSQQ